MDGLHTIRSHLLVHGGIELMVEIGGLTQGIRCMQQIRGIWGPMEELGRVGGKGWIKWEVGR